MMENFIYQLDDENKSSRLERAIRGKGAFRYFKDTLYDLNGNTETGTISLRW